MSIKVHQMPYYGPKEFTLKTIESWLRDYRQEGFNGLKPRSRSDKGHSRKIAEELQEKLSSLRQV